MTGALSQGMSLAAGVPVHSCTVLIVIAYTVLSEPTHPDPISISQSSHCRK